MYNTVCWTSFFHNIKVIVLVKKMKAPLLLQIDETYNQAIAAMECVFLRYIDKCKFRSYRERLFGSYNSRWLTYIRQNISPYVLFH